MNPDDDLPIPVKCLLVDDLEENLLALAALLREDGVELLAARSGAEALELLLAHDVALALIDVQMPGMDGLELAELMRGSERTRQVPIIFVTAGARDRHRVFKGYESGAVDFLYKPIEPHILTSKVGVFFDLYRHKQRLAHELREKSETLRLNEMFVAVLGHDLRNPLGAIITLAHVLLGASQDKLVQDTAARLLSSGQWMSRMINDTLDLARARLGGGIALHREAGDLDAAMRRVVHEMHAANPEQRIELQTEGDLHGLWDGDRLAQVASNLIGNALQHGVPGAAVQVRLDGAQEEHVVLSIVNAGGIAAESLPHLFDAFRGGDRPLGRKAGLGLGLYIVQQIVQAHGGSVELDAAEAEAERTLVRVILPRRPPPWGTL